MATGAELAALAHRAALLEQAGRLDEAEAVHRQLVARRPDLPDSWFNLAVVQRKARRYDAALASYQQALDRGVSQPEEAHLNRGVIYSDGLRRDDLAAAELQAALRLNPNYVPALLNLANLQEDLGNAAEALALYERLLAIDPLCHSALARHANLRCAKGPDAATIARLRAALARPDVAPADRANLGFALGLALEKAGEFDAAFAAIASANEQSRVSAGPSRARYDRAAHERFVDELIAGSADRAPIARPANVPVRPVFICGMFRSGSTLVEQVLAGHPDVSAGGEIDLLPLAVRTELAPFPSSLKAVPAARLERLAGRYLRELATLHPGARVVTDKRPDNFLYIGLIKTLFPDARIVHTVRNPLDVCLSIYFLHLDHGMSYALDLRDIGHYFREYRRLMAHWRTLHGADILDFDYDDFVREPRPAVERLLDFCGLDWSESCLAFHERKGAVKTASVWQVRQPLYRHASGRSRKYARHVRELAAYLGVPPPEQD
jgi:lipoprotein NlpI